MNTAEKHMQHCLELAAKGLGKVAPNPMVGCVLVHDDKIVAEGFHEIYGGHHAEVNAIRDVDDELLKKCTLYVNLEPCSHFGKTPPCADLIISKGIKKVVIGNLDSNPLVARKGIKKLQEAGIEVQQGILNKECRELNKRFFTFHEKKRPYIILKWAQTQDGFIAQNSANTKENNWITCEESKKLVHQWRAEEQAILIGYNTALMDNPLLTTRLVKGKNPIRIIIDEHLELPSHLFVFNEEAKTIIINSIKNETNKNSFFVKVDFNNLLSNLFDYCYAENIQSIIIEGGTKTLNLFINQNYWDEARIFVNPHKQFKTGIAAPDFNLENAVSNKSGTDILYLLKNNAL